MSTSPSHRMAWRMPMPSSRTLRHRFSRTGRPSRRSARSMNRSIPAPNSSEKIPMNFWSMKISPNTPMVQSSQVSDPPALRFRYGASPCLKETAFIKTMTNTATPRRRSRLVMRSASVTGPEPFSPCTSPERWSSAIPVELSLPRLPLRVQQAGRYQLIECHHARREPLLS